MPVSNISSGSMWAISGGQHEISLTIARGSRGWAFAETSLARIGSTDGAAFAWVSGTRTQPSDDQILNGIAPDPDGASSATWIANCLSATFTVRVVNQYAFAIAKLSSWNP